ncbi:Uma2 family endonuclease [Nostoc sp. FACHB-87]|uniref:Uma2 family endonuclease n=1 Tax=Nostocaceae TaxID=1162 RepID=UPI001684A42D|nr:MULTISPECIES: Uma2 family endonuclease [Nostocaceae]MBD2455666.1 Uma2 family endonuclease [Nostoc sp. FACHB-87]MBD2477297.1 Uma2 family endonuclease [Anabaena sp. FACHB-83]
MSIPLVEQSAEEKLITLKDVSWEQFKGIEAQLLDNHNVRLSYLSGMLEIMSPIGEEHEYVKRTLDYLLEAYMRELGIRFYGRGGYTLEEPGYASGTPDESYSIGTKKEVPDIVIEVIITSGTINRKELYKPKKVPEVWFWKSNSIKIFRLSEQGEYEEVERSGFFPNLDPSILLKYITIPDQYDAVQQFIQDIRN